MPLLLGSPAHQKNPLDYFQRQTEFRGVQSNESSCARLLTINTSTAMAESERSFADRLQKAQQLRDACAGFAPVYSTPPQGTTLPAFTTKIAGCDADHQAVESAEILWSEAVERRTGIADTIRTTATQLLNYIKSSTAWKTKLPKAKQFADAIRGIKHPRKAPAPAPPGGTAPKRRQRGGQSYAELERNWRALVTLAGGLAGFAPTDVKIQLGTINGLLSSIRGVNSEISASEATLGEAQQVRQQGFYEEDAGLESLFLAVKTNVKGQYGTASPQWAQVKGMKW